MTEEEESGVIEVLPGWLELLTHRVKTFGIIAASLAIDAVFMLFWLVIHGLFNLTATFIEKVLSDLPDMPAASSAHSMTIQPFKAVFVITVTLLDLAAFAVMVYFIYTDVRIFWRKISPPKEVTVLIGPPAAKLVSRSSLTEGVRSND